MTPIHLMKSFELEEVIDEILRESDDYKLYN